MEQLKIRLYEREREEKDSARAEARKDQQQGFMVRGVRRFIDWYRNFYGV